MLQLRVCGGSARLLTALRDNPALPFFDPAYKNLTVSDSERYKV
jgi:hypothetical protein